MKSKFIDYKQRALELRKKGMTYGEIINYISVKIPKSTLSIWFKDLKLSTRSKERLNKVISLKLKESHKTALESIKKKREIYLAKLKKGVAHLPKYKENQDIAKIMLAMLYLGEGTKTKRGSLLFANSDPKIIYLFLSLLKKCYYIDERKFRCTIQCRADQNIPMLEDFWMDITKIPKSQFYKTRIDPRTIGKKSKKLDYKGVCCIDYFSADVYNEIKIIMDIICYKGH